MYLKALLKTQCYWNFPALFYILFCVYISSVSSYLTSLLLALYCYVIAIFSVKLFSHNFRWKKVLASVTIVQMIVNMCAMMECLLTEKSRCSEIEYIDLQSPINLLNFAYTTFSTSYCLKMRKAYFYGSSQDSSSYCLKLHEV